MNTNKNIKIYSINIDNSDNQLIEVESIILNGLYKFTIIGINPKNSTDIKDRVYSALRYEKILNLKSDNKKITINIIPNVLDKKINIYDLAIAISCYFSINTPNTQSNNIDEILIIGELSITGNILKSGFLFKTLQTAIKNKVKTIACSKQELKTIENDINNNWYKIIKENNIKFITGETLKDMVFNIKAGTYSIPNIKNITHKTYLNKIELFNTNIFKIILSMCSKYNIIIEHINNSYVEKFIKNTLYYNQKLSADDILLLSNTLNKDDETLINQYNHPLTTHYNKNIDYIEIIKENIFGLNIIDDITETTEDCLHTIIKNNATTLFVFYKTCPCGNNNLSLALISDNKCFCIQRNIIRYKQKIKKLDKDLFTLQIKEDYPLLRDHTIDLDKFNHFYDDDSYININKFINLYRNTTVSINIKPTTLIYIDELKSRLKDNLFFDKIIKTSKDICKFNFLNNKKDGVCLLSKEDLILSEQLLKKDF